MAEHKTDRCITIPPELATAIVAAQKAVESLKRDSTGDKGRYTTADEIAFVARQMLTKHGAAWVRLDVTLETGALAQADIGKQAYVGDLVETWAIVHEAGGVLLGSSRMPVITSMGRPHDKAVGASLTYDVGGALRGALCMDREDKNAPDRREDKPGPEQQTEQREPQPAQPTAAKPTIGRAKKGEPLVKSITALVQSVAEDMATDPDRVWRSVLKSTGVSAPDIGSLSFEDAKLVKAKLEAKRADLPAPPQPTPADMEALRNEIAKLWSLICKGPEGYDIDEWKPEWARFGGLTAWPDQPSAAEYRAAITGMRAEIAKMNS